jgi:hypothetical protein
MKKSEMDSCHDIGIDQASADDALILQLRGLRREASPAADLWPGIAARLQAPPVAHRPVVRMSAQAVRALPPGWDVRGALNPGVTSGPQQNAATRRRVWQVPLALAATVMLALGITGWWQFAESPTSIEQSVVQREAMGMTRQYQAALAELGSITGAGTPVALQPAFDDLDRNARLILEAIDHDPDSRLLLQQLRRTYSRHLALAQRNVPG